MKVPPLASLKVMVMLPSLLTWPVACCQEPAALVTTKLPSAASSNR